MHVSSYVHMLEGRLRVKVWEIKGSRDKAVEVEEMLCRLHGVSDVKANTITGNLLVLFDSKKTNHYYIIGALKDLGCLGKAAASTATPANKWTETVLGPLAQVVIERAILALI